LVAGWIEARLIYPWLIYTWLNCAGLVYTRLLIYTSLIYTRLIYTGLLIRAGRSRCIRRGVVVSVGIKRYRGKRCGVEGLVTGVVVYRAGRSSGDGLITRIRHHRIVAGAALDLCIDAAGVGIG
jgi:hypothetical protein